MRCLKCGTEIDAPEVFCEPCREVMKKNPVSRETRVVIQPRPEYTPMRSRPAKPEELLAQADRSLRKSRRTSLLLLLLCLALCVALVLSFRFGGHKIVIGQNYTTITEATTAPIETADTVETVMLPSEQT